MVKMVALKKVRHVIITVLARKNNSNSLVCRWCHLYRFPDAWDEASMKALRASELE